MKKLSTRVLKGRINRDLDSSSAGVQIIGLRKTPRGYEYRLPCDQFDELSREEIETIDAIVKKHCGKVA
jgi:hypothetical protein